MRSADCMDTIQPHSHRPPKVGGAALARIGLRLRDALGRGFDRLLLWAERSEQRHQLAELNDHMLRDIGLSRVDVMAEATKPFWRA